MILVLQARYKQSLDPTVDEVKKLCTSLRRNAKEERVLFHYNGHGVPRPTVNGEIWVFNKVAPTRPPLAGISRSGFLVNAHVGFSLFQNYTQYIPLSIYDLQTWMGSPSIFVYDCSNAGIIVKSFKQFALQREQELEVSGPPGAVEPSQTHASAPSRHAGFCYPEKLLLTSCNLSSCQSFFMSSATRWCRNVNYLLIESAAKLVEEPVSDGKTIISYIISVPKCLNVEVL